MGSIACHLLPGKDTARAISPEIARSNNTAPSYDAYLIPKLTEKPWVIPKEDKAASTTRCDNGDKENKRREILEMGFRRWIIYKLHFVGASELGEALAPPSVGLLDDSAN